jgi:hypothetical protein
MTRRTRTGFAIVAVVVVLPIAAFVVLWTALSEPNSLPTFQREITLPNHGSLIIDGKKSGRSEHGYSQRAGYRSPGSTGIEWFGEVSDGVVSKVYQAGPLLVVIDFPAAQLYVRSKNAHWKNLALVFPDDLGPFPVSFYVEKTSLTAEEVLRIDRLGGKHGRKYPTTYIQSFDPNTRDLNCSYYLDNQSSWPLHLRLSEDGTRLSLIDIGAIAQ